MFDLKNVKVMLNFMVAMVVGNCVWLGHTSYVVGKSPPKQIVNPCQKPVQMDCPISKAYCFLREDAEDCGNGVGGAMIHSEKFGTQADPVTHFAPNVQKKCYTSCTCKWDADNDICKCDPNANQTPHGEMTYKNATCWILPWPIWD